MQCYVRYASVNTFNVWLLCCLRQICRVLQWHHMSIVIMSDFNYESLPISVTQRAGWISFILVSDARLQEASGITSPQDSHQWSKPGRCGIEVTMMTSSNGYIFRGTGLVCGEFIGDRWTPRTKANDAELWCFLSSASEPTIEQTMKTLVIWDATVLIMTSLLWNRFFFPFYDGIMENHPPWLPFSYYITRRFNLSWTAYGISRLEQHWIR